MKRFVAAKEVGFYNVDGPVSSDDILHFARTLVSRRFRKGTKLTCSELTKDFLRLTLSEYEHEVFYVVYLDNQHHVVSSEEAFQGTIDGCAVYPREILKRAIRLNAAAVIFAHNHPSGTPDPSQSDIQITQRLKQALGTVDIRVLDHCIVGGDEIVSFAERGLL